MRYIIDFNRFQLVTVIFKIDYILRIVHNSKHLFIKIACSAFLKSVCHINKKNPDYEYAMRCLKQISINKDNPEIDYLKLICIYKSRKYQEVIKYYLDSQNKKHKLNYKSKFIIASSYDKLDLKDCASIIYQEIYQNSDDLYKTLSLNNLIVIESKYSNYEEVYKNWDNIDTSYNIYHELGNNIAICSINNGDNENGVKTKTNYT